MLLGFFFNLLQNEKNLLKKNRWETTNFFFGVQWGGLTLYHGKEFEWY